MAEQLWRRCGKARQFWNKRWYCDCHKYDTLVPVAEGALLIEDREAAIGRMEAVLDEFWGYFQALAVEPDPDDIAAWCDKLLRAAVGGEED